MLKINLTSGLASEDEVEAILGSEGSNKCVVDLGSGVSEESSGLGLPLPLCASISMLGS